MSRSADALAGLMGAGKFTELRSRLLFVIGALIVYRIGCYIPVPGVNPEALQAIAPPREASARLVGSTG